MSGSGTTQTTNSNVVRDPYAPAQPGLQSLLTAAQNVFDSGQGGVPYSGQRVAGLGDNTQAGLGWMANNATAGQPAAMAGNAALTSLLANGGATGGTMAADNAIAGVRGAGTRALSGILGRAMSPGNTATTVGNDLVGGAYNLDGSGLQSLNDQLAGPTQTERSLQDTADGKFLGAANPYLNDMIAQGTGDTVGNVAAKFAASGRYGSGRFAGAVADATDRVGTGLRYQDYDAERARIASAAGAIDSAGLARTATRSGLFDAANNVMSQNAGQAVTGAQLTQSQDAQALNAANSLASTQGQNANLALNQGSTLLGSAQSDRAATLAGIGAQGANNANLLAPGSTLAGVGAIQDAARQQELDSAKSTFDENQAAPWKQMGLYSSILDPIAGLGGTTTGTESRTTPAPGLMQQIMGGASSAVGLLGATGAFPAATAGSSGWLASALPMLLASDERLKEDVERVGKLDDGQPIYRYNYRDDPTPRIGLLAQEVQKRRPEAVGLLDSGYLGVDYAKATEGAARKAAGARR